MIETERKSPEMIETERKSPDMIEMEQKGPATITLGKNVSWLDGIRTEKFRDVNKGSEVLRWYGGGGKMTPHFEWVWIAIFPPKGKREIVEIKREHTRERT